MPLQVFNTLTRRKEEFQPREPGKVSIYVCGVTPYNFCHVGNARPYLVWDVFRRYFAYKGYSVRYVQNFTDVDDKIINKAREEGTGALAVADRYIKAYFADMDALGIQRADVYPRVTDHIPDIIRVVAGLVKSGHAYVLDGDVYYSVESFQEYGKLSGRSLEELNAGARVEVNEKKHHPMDFALWKAAKEGEPAWDSPWGPGRPGWHIECSVMALKYLGAGFDFHGGGSDLIFPHHENEIAQSEAYTGSTFARYWVHNGFVNMGGEKMAKSVGNVVRVRDVLERFPGAALRYYMLSTHYRSPIDFSLEEMPAAQRGWERLHHLEENLARVLGAGAPAVPAQLSTDARALLAKLDRYRRDFEAAMDDDFNTAQALATLFDLARDLNAYLAAGEVSGERAYVLAQGREVFLTLGGVLGLTGLKAGAQENAALLEGLIELVAELRQEARRRKDFATADRVRDRLAELGVILEDTAQGPRWRFK
ncbi:cysteine--tRNA ligase [Gelria sp. Kuro-4]|uniref:cysteine--tRNA ligase n=1 Tax=Gelria sp. Kuro-4 TaxID=2796927 RepID=UPI001BF12670|nr:cysteine--tRNA ligase [Gelria sp. Kuro-4]BCV23343.1 cysteine--tRNA ligase [Gelria sp. Kuro-4]